MKAIQKTIQFLLVVVLLLLASACQAPAPEVIQFTEEDEAAIRQISQQMVQSIDDWSMFYTEDVVIMPPNEAIIEGKAAYNAWAESSPLLSTFELTQHEITGHGDLAYVRGAYSLTMTPAEGDTLSDHGKYIEIWKRQSDGSWLVSHDIWNSDQPLP